MHDGIFVLFGLAVFIAVALALEGAYLWWSTTRGPEVKRIERRLRTLAAGGHGQEQVSILKRRVLAESPTWAKLLFRLPRVEYLDRLLLQSGLPMTVGRLLGFTLALAATGLVVALYLGRGLPAGLVLALILGALPMFHVVRTKGQRLQAMERQLPDAIDLMARALRAGHAFPTALKMVGDEMADPVGSEFRTLFDEVNYGISLQDGLLNLVSRVPSADLQHFVVAVLIQRETGGNLAELLDNISSIIRSRLKLHGHIRTLSAEGRLSAWILGLLPFGTAGVIYLTNPEFLAVLGDDPTGRQLVGGALLAMVLGVVWMRQIIRIRV